LQERRKYGGPEGSNANKKENANKKAKRKQKITEVKSKTPCLVFLIQLQYNGQQRSKAIT